MSALDKALLLAIKRVNNLAVTSHSTKNLFFLFFRNIKTFWYCRVFLFFVFFFWGGGGGWGAILKTKGIS